MLMEAAQASPDDFPLVSMPSTNKLVRMLGPEVAVFQPDEGGLLMKSRGLVPFSTKAPFLYPVAGFGIMYLLF